ncbi:MAG TPA: tetratricopeptide repeat protein [Verrucomicrobiae bacterium]|nr:tetratricopeptide repeat protein [Verrucomicrobiae bacterium]
MMNMKRPVVCILMFFAGTVPWICLAQPIGTNSILIKSTVNESWLSISNRWSAIPLAQLRREAAGGDASAELYLGNCYLVGNGIATNTTEALKWIKTASDQGSATAQVNLGKMYELGNGVSQDYSVALKLYRLAAEQGNARAQNNLGSLYYQGLGVPQDTDEAMKWYGKSAEQGNEFGESNLGWIYGFDWTYGPAPVGQRVKRNYELAEKWMRMAAEQGAAEMQYRYAFLLNEEFDENNQPVANHQVAAEWYRKAADQGYDQAEYALAEMYNYGELGDDQRSNCIPWYLKAAAHGNAKAQSEIGELPLTYPHSELLKSVNIIGALRQSAEKGNWDAQWQLAKRYQTGDGVPKDAAEAFKWMRETANHQNEYGNVPDAIFELAKMYEKGEGTTKDIAEAHRLYLEAAEVFRIPDAALRVGQMYENGDGVPQDDRKAAEFYANEYHFITTPDDPRYIHPEKYPDVIQYSQANDAAIESLLRLWSQGRGFPDERDKTLPGYRKPEDLIASWTRSITSAQAQDYAGEIYYQGKLVPKDFAKAADWFTKAAEQGSAHAMNRIGEMWAAGSNSAPDPPEAAKWYQRAATQGLAEAQYNLGLCYAKGEGVPVNPTEAWKWLQLAAEQNYPKAAEERQAVQSHMTEDQINAARTLADQGNSGSKR